MRALMTKPTHFFLGLLSNLFSSPKIVPGGQEVPQEKAVEASVPTAPIPSDTPKLENNNSGYSGFGFRYGAAISRKW